MELLQHQLSINVNHGGENHEWNGQPVCTVLPGQQNWNGISLHLPINQDLWGAFFMKRYWPLTKYVPPEALIDEFSHAMRHVYLWNVS